MSFVLVCARFYAVIKITNDHAAIVWILDTKISPRAKGRKHAGKDNANSTRGPRYET